MLQADRPEYAHLSQDTLLAAANAATRALQGTMLPGA